MKDTRAFEPGAKWRQACLDMRQGLEALRAENETLRARLKESEALKEYYKTLADRWANTIAPLPQPPEVKP